MGKVSGRSGLFKFALHSFIHLVILYQKISMNKSFMLKRNKSRSGPQIYVLSQTVSVPADT